jgi:GNAT superfamily N-acetyltransferase
MQPVVIERPASELRLAQVIAFLREIYGTPAGDTQPDGPFKGIGRATFVDDQLVGLIVGHPAPGNERPEEQMLFVSGGVHVSRRRQGIGGRLIEALLAECGSMPGKVTAFTHVSEADAVATAPFLLRHGFEPTRDMLRYERDLQAAPPAQPAPEQPILVKPYGGGDPATDAAIAGLYQWGFRGRAAIPQRSSEAVQRRTKDPASAHFLAFDGSLLVGYASTYTAAGECVIDSLVVARSHWRTGTSDALVQATIHHAAGQACRCIVGYVEDRNHASRALAERHGLAATQRHLRYRRVFASW